MSLKRKFEEYHDPDYPQQAPSAKQSRPNILANAEERAEKIRTIVRREFQLEHQRKEDELQQIEQKLLHSKRLLQRVRYAVVANFYSQPNLEYTEQELQQVNVVVAESQSTAAVVETKSMQAPIHPSLKKLLGKRPIDYDEILKIRPARQAAKTAKTSLSEKLRTKKEQRRHKQPEAVTIREDVGPKVPRYVSPIKSEPQFEKLTSARGRNNFRHLLAVGKPLVAF